MEPASSRFGFMAIAIVFHLVYIFSIFDIYFVSPVVSGMTLFTSSGKSDHRPPADRLVLFVGDGLRADKAFQSFPEPYPKPTDDLRPRPLAPFLRSRVLEHGTFGVSHTRVPTESRPGHVALIAGLYEDVSAVTTGWKLNPVNFDSVFNRSRHTWSWGSPDILPMFEKGAVPGRVDAATYGPEFEDFSQDSVHLDYWVFDRVKEFFALAATNSQLAEELERDKLVFFLHLLGVDTAGHSHRPYSKEYLYNIQVVDEGVREITELFEAFFKDDRTAFVFTADHGMSDWGSHGDGHPDNTRTPLIAWGSGVAKPSFYPSGPAPGHDDFSADWALDHVRRHDVAQADVAALMSYLVGLEYPANSVGELPLSYLSASLEDKAYASLANAKGILEMYRVKEEKKKSTLLQYRSFPSLSIEEASRRLEEIQKLLDEGQYEEAIEETAVLLKLGLQGLRYLQTYDWLFLRALISVGYLGWMAYALSMVIELHVIWGRVPPARSMPSVVGFSSVLAGLYATFIVSRSPPAYYAYAFFPVFFWEEVYARRRGLVEGGQLLLIHVKNAGERLTLAFNVAAFIGIFLSLALGYIHREVFTCLFILGALWPFTYGISFLCDFGISNAVWILSCLVMSVFTLLPANKAEDVNLIVTGGLFMSALGLGFLIFEDKFVTSPATARQARNDSTASSGVLRRAMMGAQIGLVVLAVLVTRSSALSMQAKQGLPRGNQVVGWLLLVTSFLMPLAYKLQPSRRYEHRLMVYILTFAPTFVILTISYEGLFYVAFCVNVASWVTLEHNIRLFRSRSGGGATSENGKTDGLWRGGELLSLRRLELTDARVALFFFVLLHSGFFSTGNIASISTFSLESVSRLIPVFDPFSQGALLILKIIIPFALISANLGVLNRRIGVAPSALFMLVMAISDILTLYFFWVVKDEGSWLEIGSTISHFVIASLLFVFVAALEVVSEAFISGIEFDGVERCQGREAGSNGVSAKDVLGCGERKTQRGA